MNRDRQHDLREPRLPEVTPGPGYRCDGPFPYHQPVNERDIERFLRHTEGLPGHTFTETGRS